MTRGFWVLAVLTIGLAAGPARSDSRLSYDSLWKDATTRPNHSVQDHGDVTIVTETADMVIYYFTKPGHPAHPGVAKRIVEQKDGTVSVHTEGYSFGPKASKPAFRKWMDQFKEMDRQINRDTEQHQAAP